MNGVLCFVILLLLHAAVDPLSGQECSSLYTCSSCLIMNTSCAWCNSPALFNELASDMTSLSPAQLCGTLEELAAINCTEESIINPSTFINVTESNKSAAVSVEKIQVVTRPGEQVEVVINVMPPLSVSVDMYVLLDLTMDQTVFGTIQQSSNELVELMRNLSDTFRIAFGTYVDKPISPFINQFNTLCSNCQPAHAFRHLLNFTEEAEQFKDLILNETRSDSEFERKSLMDAILQIAACEEEFGWSAPGTTRRILLVLTEADYHCALDGRIAGLHKLPDNVCRVNFETGFYDAASDVDYPSITFVQDLLNEQQISVMLANNPKETPIYEKLKAFWRAVFLAIQSPQSFSLLDEIEKQYLELISTIVPEIRGLERIPEIQIDVLPREGCSNGTLRVDTDDICEQVNLTDSVNYTVNISVDPSFCDRSDQNSTIFTQVLFIGYGVVDIEIAVNCSCDCAPPEPNSAKCEGRGTYECSTCVCPEEYNGPQCSCEQNVGNIIGCVQSGGGRVCSGRGQCICGQCICDIAVNTNGHTYQGLYCECEPSSCPEGENDETNQVLPCAGQGVCGCDLKCQCDPGFTGPSCECSNQTSSCLLPDSGPEAKLCSGSGQCVCGVCNCNNYTIRAGTYCEQCGVCATSCSTLRSCMECILRGDCAEQELDCSNIKNVSNIELIPDYNNIAFRNCSLSLENCEIIYSVNQFVIGDETEDIYVYINPDQASYVQYLDNSDGCAQALVIWPIPVGIVLGIILVIIIALFLWKGISYLGEYIEYKTWENSQRTESWERSGQNPIFVEPTAKYINPRYHPQPINMD